MTFRLILLIAAAWIVWRLLRGLRVHVSRVDSPPQTPKDSFEPMARCARCGVHLPASSLSPAGLCGRCTAE